MILAVDPGSKRIGWAVMSSASTLVEAGLITASTDDASDRVDEIAAKLGQRATELKAKLNLSACVLETSSARQARRMKGRMIGLQTLGASIQACKMVLRMSGLEVHCIKENVWTRGVPKLGISECKVCRERYPGDRKTCNHRKAKGMPVCGGAMALVAMGRVDYIAKIFEGHDWSFDVGGDVRDAVGLGKYWWEWEKPRRETQQP